MYHYIYIINQDPLFGLFAFVFIGKFTTLFVYLILNIIGNSSKLIIVVSLANDKKIGYGFRDFF